MCANNGILQGFRQFSGGNFPNRIFYVWFIFVYHSVVRIIYISFGAVLNLQTLHLLYYEKTYYLCIFLGCFLTNKTDTK